MTNFKIKIFAVITVLILIGGALYYLTGDRLLELRTWNLDENKPISDNQAPSSNDQALSSNDQALSSLYENLKYGFSFNYSKEFSVSEFTEGEADIVLIKDVTGDGFQISITPFDEPFDSAQGKSGPITKERILKDIPNMRIGNDKEISVGGEKALSFISKDASLETLEIWLVRGGPPAGLPTGKAGEAGNLYQISAFPGFSRELNNILATWKF